jgi:cytidylate kinase
VLVERQRAYGAGRSVVMEGRDIGSVVFPDADVKVYLDASPEERARRRALDLAHSAGRDPGGLVRVAEALEERDHSDRTRRSSPLTQAPDAVHIDTTDRSIAEVVAEVMLLVDKARGGLRAPGAGLQA